MTDREETKKILNAILNEEDGFIYKTTEKIKKLNNFLLKVVDYYELKDHLHIDGDSSRINNQLFQMEEEILGIINSFNIDYNCYYTCKTFDDIIHFTISSIEIKLRSFLNVNVDNGDDFLVSVPRNHIAPHHNFW